jgi:hypothetical protein
VLAGEPVGRLHGVAGGADVDAHRRGGPRRDPACRLDPVRAAAASAEQGSGQQHYKQSWYCSAFLPIHNSFLPPLKLESDYEIQIKREKKFSLAVHKK